MLHGCMDAHLHSITFSALWQAQKKIDYFTVAVKLYSQKWWKRRKKEKKIVRRWKLLPRISKNEISDISQIRRSTGWMAHAPRVIWGRREKKQSKLFAVSRFHVVSFSSSFGDLVFDLVTHSFYYIHKYKWQSIWHRVRHRLLSKSINYIL